MFAHPGPLHPIVCQRKAESSGLGEVKRVEQASRMLDVHLGPDATALEEAVENSHDCITLVDMQGRVLFMNLPGLWQLELEGDPGTSRIAWSELWSRENAELAEYSIESARSGRACRFTACRPTSRGAAKWWDVAVNPIFDRRGLPVQMFCVSRDITELKARELALQRELAEKETLLSEVNHRIKNALAAIAGLLSLQARQSQDAAVHACLQQAQSRVLAIAEIHRRIYEMAGHDCLDIGDCIADVARGTISTLDASVNIELRTACEHGVSLKSDQAITFALLTSELITNCVKHAFEGNDGKVEVAFSAGPTQLFLRVHDNGRGLPEGFDPRKSGGSGMKILLNLVRQLRGELSIARSGRGAHFDIVVPREPLPNS